MYLPLLETWEIEPLRIRNRDLRKNKYKTQKEQELMGRPHTNIKRQKAMGSHGVKKQGTGPAVGTTKQYMQSGPKATGPNYPDASVTGPLQNGGRGGRGAK